MWSLDVCMKAFFWACCLKWWHVFLAVFAWLSISRERDSSPEITTPTKALRSVSPSPTLFAQSHPASSVNWHGSLLMLHRSQYTYDKQWRWIEIFLLREQWWMSILKMACINASLLASTYKNTLHDLLYTDKSMCPNLFSCLQYIVYKLTYRIFFCNIFTANCI